MPENIERQIGNMYPPDIEDTEDQFPYGNGRGVPSLASQWAMQGIGYRLTDPVPTDAHTSEELAAMGLKGVTIILPSEHNH